MTIEKENDSITECNYCHYSTQCFNSLEYMDVTYTYFFSNAYILLILDTIDIIRLVYSNFC